MLNLNQLMTQSREVFIPGQVPSSKNSQQWIGKALIKSKTVQNYLKEHGIKSYSVRERQVQEYKTRPNTFRACVSSLEGVIKHYPCRLEFTFTRKTKAKFDLINAAQILQDLLVAHQIIPDDSYEYLIPVFNEKTTVDKDNPGVTIKVL
jgi:hypothetical protein